MDIMKSMNDRVRNFKIWDIKLAQGCSYVCYFDNSEAHPSNNGDEYLVVCRIGNTSWHKTNVFVFA